MTSEFTRVTVDDAVELILDHRGRTPKKLGGDFTHHGVQVISAKNVYDHRLHADESQRFVSPEMARRWMPNPLNSGDVLLTSEAPLGEVAYLNGSPNFCLGQRLFGLRARPGVADSRFLYYAFISPAVQARLHARASGTTAQGIRQSELRQVELDLPTLPEQERIASVLGALDDKFDSNRRLARLLEDTAATLFRARFLDFLGVEDLEASELGPIPKRWAVRSIYEVACVTYGRPFKSSLFNADEGVPVLRIRDLPTDEPSVLTSEERADARLVRPGDIVVGMDGEFRAYIWAGPDSWLNQRVCVFDPRDGVSRVFVFEAIKPLLRFFEATKGGTTVIHLGKRDIDTFRIVVPPPSVMRDFSEEADPLLASGVALRLECRRLAAIRDTLLPKLVSGQIRVPDTGDPGDVIEPLVDEVA